MSLKIEFRKSGKTFEWDDSFENLLDFAEEKGISMESTCRVGVCGTCKVKLISGEVFMEAEDGLDEDDKSNQMILPCVATPQTDLAIDA
jgi:ferredoxin